jgi:serine/threonine-protein kinase
MSQPTHIGALRVDGVLGEGGMGRVYLCTDEGLSRQVAVKTLLPELLTNDTMRERFVREARALAKVDSPFVVRVHAIGEDAAVGPFVVMERLSGEDVLEKLRRDGAFTIADAVTVAAAVADGLAAAHLAGVVHRDIKPANIFLRGGAVQADSVVITDFGLAKDLPTDVAAPGSVDGVSAAQLTSADIVVGTPAYLAPEMARGQKASPASDLYALGATLFHLVAGTPPFPGDSPIDVLTKSVLEPAPRAKLRCPDLPEALDDLIDTLLRKSPTERPSDAAKLAQTLREQLSALSSSPASSTSSLMSSLSSPTEKDGATKTQVMGTLSGDGSAEVAASSSSSSSASPPLAPTSPPSTLPPPSSDVTAPTGPAASEAAALSASASLPRAPTVKTATYTVMMTDIAGYTERTGRQSRDEAARWLDLHDKLLQPIFRAFGGKVVKTIGDAFMVVFSSPTDAVHCGMAIQDRLFAHNAVTVADDHIRVRVALSVGEVRVRGIVGMGGDIFGEPVNLAARIEALASPGEVLMSDGVFATMNQAEVKTEQRGNHSFKGISRPVAVHAVVPSGAAGQAPFSNTTLGRVGSGSAMDVVADGAKAIGPALQRAQGRATEFLALKTGKDVGTIKTIAAVAAAVVAFVVVLAMLFSGGPKARIRRGEAAAVLAEFEAKPAKDRSASDLVVLGLANAAVERRASAMALMRSAVAAGSDDDDIVEAAIVALDDRSAKDAIAILAEWKSDISAELRDQLSGGWWPRHNALQVLDKRGVATDADRQRVALLDVDADDCASRRFGLVVLKRSGVGEEAMAAVRALGQNGLANICMAMDLNGAEEAIRRRSEGK